MWNELGHMTEGDLRAYLEAQETLAALQLHLARKPWERRQHARTIERCKETMREMAQRYA